MLHHHVNPSQASFGSGLWGEHEVRAVQLRPVPLTEPSCWNTKTSRRTTQDRRFKSRFQPPWSVLSALDLITLDIVTWVLGPLSAVDSLPVNTVMLAQCPSLFFKKNLACKSARGWGYITRFTTPNAVIRSRRRR